MSSSAKTTFRDDEVADYERRRYRGLDQRLVHSREKAILSRMLESIVASAPAPRAGLPLALDAPCGYGRFTGLLADAGFLPVSSDLSPAMVRRARSKDVNSINPIGIVSNLTAGLPFRSGVFRLVFSLRFFHHLHRTEDRRRALGEFARVSGGWILLSFYQANVLHLFQRRLRRLVKRSRTRIKMIGRAEFESDLRAAGLEIVRIVPLFRGLHAQHIALLKRSEPN